MEKTKINRLILGKIAPRLERIGVATTELGGGFDLVNSGLVNSLEFVDLVSALEKELSCEIDFGKALEKGDLTTLDGLANALKEAAHG